MDEITLRTESSNFKLIPKQMRPFQYEKDLIQGAAIQMSMDLTIIERDGYTSLDILSDIGGLQGILNAGFSVILILFNYKYLDSYLATKLYKTTMESNNDGLD